MTKKPVFIGIDTSNYTTSIAVADVNGNVVLNLKKLLDVKEGERGLRQSDAVFAHVKNLSLLSDELASALCGCEVLGIGVSVSPRDVEGSYMPCFVVGKSLADILSATHNASVYYFSHQSGHIMAALYSSGQVDSLFKSDFIAFHVSGGTTEALLVKPHDGGFKIDLIAESADISAGQAIDRAGVMMGLKFPCGKEIERLANDFAGSLPKPKICVKGTQFNLSGLENIAQKLYAETSDERYVSAYVLNFVCKTLVTVTQDLREKHGNLPIVYAGGVMSNKFLQNELSKFDKTYFATPEFSTDNASGVALLARKNHK